MAESNEFSHLTTAPASDFKNKGWRRIRRRLIEEGHGTLLVTNHNEPEAIILSPEEYARITRLTKQAGEEMGDALAALRRDFDERLARLKAADAGQRLRSVMDEPVRLQGEVKAGQSY
jgi:PHD/YefM family antitoxin component YafN of YafNO toxin-antitoxin module